MTHARYLVSGTRAYRGHRAGSTFTARLDRLAEQRAIDRGDITLIERLIPRLPDTFSLPRGWVKAGTGEE